VAGFSGDGGLAVLAKIRSRGGQAAQPSGRIAMNAAGDLFIADTGNNLVRKVSAGIITTVAGDTTGARAGTNGGFSGDGGPATSARLNSPSDIEIGPDGNLYIADTRNHYVRMVDESGIITTVVGKGGNAGYDGDASTPTESRLYQPYGIAFDAEGTLYISDTHNHRIRYVK
jgi:sugar lactone lactonase YvrE